MKFTGERIIPGDKFFQNDSVAVVEHESRYKFAKQFVKGKKVLDIACGVGYGSKILCDAEALNVIGCDISKDAIDHAIKNYGNESLSFKMMDATKLNFPDNFFDVIISFETLEHVSEYKTMLNEFFRVLKEDGMLIISTPNKDVSSKGKEKPRNPFHSQEFTKSEFINLLEENFSNIKLYSQLLIIKLNKRKQFLRKSIINLKKIDILKIRTKFPEKVYHNISSSINNTDKKYDPIEYRDEHIPVHFIAICKKKSKN